MTRAEQETIFRYAADEDVVSIFTAFPPTAHKLERAGYRPYKTSTQEGKAVGWFYRVPVAEFRWRAGRRVKRERTPAQQEAARQAGRRLRQKIDSGPSSLEATRSPRPESD